jgi:hypothetical protein
LQQETPMTKEYEISIKTEFHPAESIWIRARNAKEAISLARRKARDEYWFDRRNDGKVTYRVVN